MTRARKTGRDPFHIVREVGLELPDVDATTKYDGSPRLTVRSSFMTGLATHPSAEPDIRSWSDTALTSANG